MATTKTTITGTAAVRTMGERLILPLPEEASAQLPSRGQVAVDAVLGGTETTLVIEPDGRKGHWISLTDALVRALGAADGMSIEFSLTPSAVWPEPEIPEDLGAALAEAEDLAGTWSSITPMARWEWVRWVGATKNPATRAKRVDVSIDKLRGGKRRPCCFDLASCTDPELARSGKLIGLE
ncbi:YdeI/OmpD-associated family protein [Brachybacterium sp. YJGR34]|uniref:YdeI/OmpD-associated family protein n=1 Tax=Brachybacterium sp. YJGR34 TaxID=2059911 RepID=UPI000E0B5024|nr:YdeI/OmpD-associated family protein [Brachybacterium sp. YJGR34]